jgi:large subunit ribosomal protein L9
MNLILLSDVRKVGHRGQIVMVADGYGLNFLIPRHLAVQATGAALKAHAIEVDTAKARMAENASRMKELATRLHDGTLTVAVKTSGTGTLFEALKPEDLAAEILKQWGVEVPESAIHLSAPIKERGTYRVPIELGAERVEVEVVV